MLSSDWPFIRTMKINDYYSELLWILFDVFVFFGGLLGVRWENSEQSEQNLFLFLFTRPHKLAMQSIPTLSDISRDLRRNDYASAKTKCDSVSTAKSRNGIKQFKLRKTFWKEIWFKIVTSLPRYPSRFTPLLILSIRMNFCFYFSLFLTQALETLKGLESVPILLARAEAIRSLPDSDLKMALKDVEDAISIDPQDPNVSSRAWELMQSTKDEPDWALSDVLMISPLGSPFTVSSFPGSSVPSNVNQSFESRESLLLQSIQLIDTWKVGFSKHWS